MFGCSQFCRTSWQVIRFIFQFPMRQNWLWIPHFNMKSAMKTERVLKSTLQWCAPHFLSKRIILYDEAYQYLPRKKHKVFKPQNQNLVPLWVAYWSVQRREPFLVVVAAISRGVVVAITAVTTAVVLLISSFILWVRTKPRVANQTIPQESDERYHLILHAEPN